MFTKDQLDQLNAPLSRDAVQTREQGGRTLSYVEGWHVIAEANRIFGFGEWSSVTLKMHCIDQHERPVGKYTPKPGWGVTYNAKVRITVYSEEEGHTMREGYGVGHGIDVNLGLAHESAIKEAETDGRKRALMTFGNQFGLALYDRTQANVADADEPDPKRIAAKEDDPEAETSKQKYISQCKTAIASFKDGERDAILKWWYAGEQAREDFGLNAAEVNTMKGLAGAKANLPKTPR